ncbi:uncharacterized protein [Amphiura filiformis]|uniref:uncharacterized protein n=1 Tax=Amphiura filiformis TaxID=82378 RepID=UPI003B21940F
MFFSKQPDFMEKTTTECMTTCIETYFDEMHHRTGTHRGRTIIGSFGCEITRMEYDSDVREELLDVVARWVNHDLHKRKQVATIYFEEFELHQCSADALQKALDNGMRKIPECKMALEAVIAIKTKTLSLQRAFEISNRHEAALLRTASLTVDYMKEHFIFLSRQPGFVDETTTECMDKFRQRYFTHEMSQYNPQTSHNTFIPFRYIDIGDMLEVVTRWVNHDLDRRKQVAIDFLRDYLKQYQVHKCPPSKLQIILDIGMKNIPECKTTLEDVIAFKNITTKLQRAFEITQRPESELLDPAMHDIARLFMRNNLYHFSREQSAFMEETTKECMEAFLETIYFQTTEHTYLTERKAIFEIVCAWINHDIRQRKQFAVEYLKRFQLGLIPSDILQKALDNGISDIPECKSTLEEVIALQTQSANLTIPTPDITHPHWFQQKLQTLIHIGGKNMAYQDIKCWRDTTDLEWDTLDSIQGFPRKVRNHSVEVVNGHLCIAGGYGPNMPNVNPRRYNGFGTCLNRFDFYDLKQQVWQPLASMTTARANFALVHLKDFVYAIGGEQQGTALSDVESYSLVDKSWQSNPPLPVAIYSPSAVVYKGKILVYGRKDSVPNNHALQIFTPEDIGGNPGGNWNIALDDQQHDVRSPDTPKYVLTVQNDKVYRVTYKNRIVLVTELECDFERNPPRVHVADTEDQTRFRTSVAKTWHSNLTGQNIFSINKELYANVLGCIYKMGVTDSQEDVIRNRIKIVSLDIKDNAGCVAVMAIPYYMPNQLVNV